MGTWGRRRPAVAAALAALVVAAGLVAGPAVRPAAAQQASTTTALTVPTTVRQPAEDDVDGADASDRIWMIIGGLVVVAVLLTALTVRYWWVTRPSRRVDEAEATEPADAPAGSADSASAPAADSAAPEPEPATTEPEPATTERAATPGGAEDQPATA